MGDRDPKEIFAENIRRIRKSIGLSQEELADRAGLHRTYISSIERFERNVSLENIFLLAKALGVEPADLVTLSKNSERDR
jgi:transcriptional regulator with XRE-family HTH domain